MMQCIFLTRNPLQNYTGAESCMNKGFAGDNKKQFVECPEKEQSFFDSDDQLPAGKMEVKLCEKIFSDSGYFFAANRSFLPFFVFFIACIILSNIFIRYLCAKSLV
jgi:hypothetical protein